MGEVEQDDLDEIKADVQKITNWLQAIGSIVQGFKYFLKNARFWTLVTLLGLLFVIMNIVNDLKGFKEFLAQFGITIG